MVNTMQQSLIKNVRYTSSTLLKITESEFFKHITTYVQKLDLIDKLHYVDSVQELNKFMSIAHDLRHLSDDNQLQHVASIDIAFEDCIYIKELLLHVNEHVVSGD